MNVTNPGFNAAETKESIERLYAQLFDLAKSAPLDFGTLAAKDVPEATGVYLIYEDKSPLTPIYAGRAEQSMKKDPRKACGLRFRIMQNHLGKQGDDNFLKTLAEELNTNKQGAVDYVKVHCSCRWLVYASLRDAIILEHFLIAVFNPRLNRG